MTADVRRAGRTPKGRAAIKKVGTAVAAAAGRVSAGVGIGAIIAAGLAAGKAIENRQVNKMVADTEKRLKRALTASERAALEPQYRQHLRRISNPERKNIQRGA